MSAPVGRNDPCPCGSGRKYKQCCLVAAEAASLRWHQLRQAEGRLMPELFQVALDAWGKDGFLEAQRRFYAGHDLPDDPVGDREFESLFVTWFGLQFTQAGRRRKGLPSPDAARSGRHARRPRAPLGAARPVRMGHAGRPRDSGSTAARRARPRNIAALQVAYLSGSAYHAWAL